MQQSLPVVMVGAIEHWPALQRWSLAYFRERYGALRTECYLQEKGAIVRHYRAGLVMEDAPVRDTLDGLESGREPVHRLKDQISKFPGLEQDIEIPSYCRAGLHLESLLWITPAGATTLLHWDMPHNLFAQISGVKKFVLVSPTQTRFLYPHSFWSSTPQCSRVDVACPDLERFPRLKAMRPLECTLHPGDLLFIPSRWWHHGESPTVTISVNLWWLSWSILPAAVPAGIHRWLRGRKY